MNVRFAQSFVHSTFRKTANTFLKVNRFIYRKIPARFQRFCVGPEIKRYVTPCPMWSILFGPRDSEFSWSPLKRYLMVGSGLAFGTFAFLNREEAYSQTLPIDDFYDKPEHRSPGCSLSEVAPFRRTAEDVIYREIPSLFSKVLTLENAIFLWKLSLRSVLGTVQTAWRAADSFTNVCIFTLINSYPVQVFATAFTAANSAMENIKFKIMKINSPIWLGSHATTADQQCPQSDSISDDFRALSLNKASDASDVSEELEKPKAGAVDSGRAINIWPSSGMAAGAVIFSSAILIYVLLKRKAPFSAFSHPGSFVPKGVKDR
jgi:hypothetical protein